MCSHHIKQHCNTFGAALSIFLTEQFSFARAVLKRKGKQLSQACDTLNLSFHMTEPLSDSKILSLEGSFLVNMLPCE